jgi:hypothetical protein
VEFAALIESYRKHLKIKMRRCAAIEAKLVEKRAVPQFEGRKVEKRVFYGTLELIGAWSGQEHDGGVGFDTLNFTVYRAIGVRRGQEIEHRRLVGSGLPHGPNIAQGALCLGHRARKTLKNRACELAASIPTVYFPVLPRE